MVLAHIWSTLGMKIIADKDDGTVERIPIN